MYVVYCAGWYNPDNDAVILDLVSTIISHTYQVKKMQHICALLQVDGRIVLPHL